MTAAFAPALPDVAAPLGTAALASRGAQTLLALKPERQFYLAEAAAVAIYALILAAGLNYSTKPQEAPVEEPLELVMEQPAPAPEPPPPQEQPQEQPPPPVAEQPPPPPVAETPPVAPVEPPKPKPAPQPKPHPVVKPQPVAHKPVAAVPAPARPAPPPPGATTSAIANQIHMRLARAAANAYPEAQKPRSARIAYRVNLDASGHVTSFSITPSGNPAFDSVAQRLGGRIGTVDPPGRPAALSGVINFAYQ